MTSKVIITVGVAGSGKSRYVKNEIENIKKFKVGTTKLVSSDKYRIEMFGDLIAGNKKNSDVFEKMRQDLINAIEENVDYIYYDATNLSRRRRRALYSKIKSMRKNVIVEIVYFSLPLEQIIEQNAKRAGQEFVPEERIREMYLTQEVPRRYVDCDSIKLIGIEAFYCYKSKYSSLESLLSTVDFRWWKELSKVKRPHDNPHHLESIDEHINMAIQNASTCNLSAIDTKRLSTVALFHDLGKGISKQVGEDGVARYRGHANVSANYYLNYAYYRNGGIILKEDELILEAIHQHMNFHRGIGKKNETNNRLSHDEIRLGVLFSEIDSMSRITE